MAEVPVGVQIAQNLAEVRGRIAAAAKRSGRMPEEVHLVAVTKTRTVQEIRAAYEAGVRDIGENRVEEAEGKKPALALAGLCWHLIGHLQSRKSRTAVDLFDVIHSVDTLKLALKLDRLVGEAGKVLPILIEVNVSGEESKYGLPATDPEALFAEVGGITALPNLTVEGLMTVAFVTSDPEETRPVFARLREIQESCRERFQGTWRHLSMGMTDDYPIAVEEGATMVRIGRAIFGPRD